MMTMMMMFDTKCIYVYFLIINNKQTLNNYNYNELSQSSQDMGFSCIGLTVAIRPTMRFSGVGRLHRHTGWTNLL